jgi:hypothetical protein
VRSVIVHSRREGVPSIVEGSQRGTFLEWEPRSMNLGGSACRHFKPRSRREVDQRRDRPDRYLLDWDWGHTPGRLHPDQQLLP